MVNGGLMKALLCPICSTPMICHHWEYIAEPESDKPTGDIISTNECPKCSIIMDICGPALQLYDHNID
jgi:hypothetical protein